MQVGQAINDERVGCDADGWLPAQVAYEGGYAELTLPATDAFKILAGITLPATGARRRFLDSPLFQNPALDARRDGLG